MPSEVRVDCYHQLPRRWTQNASLCTARAVLSGATLLRLPYLRRGIMRRHSRATRAYILRFFSGSPVDREAIASFALPVRTAPWCLPDKPYTCPPMPLPRPSLCTQDMERLYSPSSGSSGSHHASDYPSRESQLDVSVEHDRLLLLCPHLDPQVPVSASEAARIVFQAWKELTNNKTWHSRSMSSGTSRQVRPRLIAHSTSGTSAENSDTALPSATHAQHDEWCRALGRRIDAELSAMPDADRDRAVQRLLMIIRRDAPDASCCTLSFLRQFGDLPRCTLYCLRLRSCEWSRHHGQMHDQRHNAPFSMLRRKTALLQACCTCTDADLCQRTCRPQQHIHAIVHHVISAEPSYLCVDPHRRVGRLKPLNYGTAPLLGCCDILPALLWPQCTRLVYTARHEMRLTPLIRLAAGLIHPSLHYMHQAMCYSAHANLPAMQLVCAARSLLIPHHDEGKPNAVYSTKCQRWGAHNAHSCSQCLHFHAYATHETTSYHTLPLYLLKMDCPRV